MTVLDLLTHLQLLYYSAAALWILFCYFTYQRVHGNLHKIPGPWLNSLSSLPRVLSVLSGKSHHHDVDLHMVYGPLVRIAPNSLSLSDPTEIETVYGVSSRFYKSRFFDSIEFEDEGIVPDPFTMKDKAMHNRMKRGAANAYPLNALVKLEPLVEKVVDRLMGILEEACARPGGRCDLGRYLHHFAMDAVLAITFGDDLRFMENGDDASMPKSMHDYMVYFAVVGSIPRLSRPVVHAHRIKGWPSSPNAQGPRWQQDSCQAGQLRQCFCRACHGNFHRKDGRESSRLGRELPCTMHLPTTVAAQSATKSEITHRTRSQCAYVREHHSRG